MTGWGQTGPLANAAGHDINYIALTGVLHAIGRKGEKPAIPLNVVGDYGGGRFNFPQAIKDLSYTEGKLYSIKL